MSAIEQELIDKIRHLNEDQQRYVLEFVRKLESPKRLTARELMQLPLEERQRIVAESIAAAADEDFETFEAYSEEDFDDPS
jgi:hypothetical protein